MAVDLGERRIGVASSDTGRMLASPYAVLERGAARAADHRRLAEIVEELGASEVVVGLPRSLDGTLGPAARAVLDEVEELRATLAVPVTTFDERLSTVEAQRRRRLADEPVSSRAAPGEERRRRRPAGARRRARAAVDDAAAAVVLQARLDADAARGGTAPTRLDEPPGAGTGRGDAPGAGG